MVKAAMDAKRTPPKISKNSMCEKPRMNSYISYLILNMNNKGFKIIRPYQAISSQSWMNTHSFAPPCPYHAPPVDQQEIGIFRASAFSVCREGSGASSQSLQWLERSVFSDSFHVNPGIQSFQIQFRDLEKNVTIHRMLELDQVEQWPNFPNPHPRR